MQRSALCRSCRELSILIPTNIYLQKSASIQPRTSSSKFYSILFNRVLIRDTPDAARAARAAAAWGTSDCSPLLSGDSGQQDHRSRFPRPSRRPPQIGWARRRAFQTTPTVAVPLRAVRVGFFLTREKSEARPRFSRSD